MSKQLGLPRSMARLLGGSVFLFGAWGCGGDSLGPNDAGVIMVDFGSSHDAGGGDAGVFLCTLPTPCAYVRYSMGDRIPFSLCHDGFVDNLDAARCILQKLRDREISALPLSIDTPLCLKNYDFTDEVLFVLDKEHYAESVHYSRGSNVDPHHVPYSGSGTSSLRTLHPPAYFDACPKETDIDKMMLCVVNPWSEDTDLPPICPP